MKLFKTLPNIFPQYFSSEGSTTSHRSRKDQSFWEELASCRHLACMSVKTTPHKHLWKIEQTANTWTFKAEYLIFLWCSHTTLRKPVIRCYQYFFFFFFLRGEGRRLFVCFAFGKEVAEYQGYFHASFSYFLPAASQTQVQLCHSSLQKKCLD